MTQPPQLPTGSTQPAEPLFRNQRQQRGKAIFDCFFCASRVMAAVALALLALTIISLAFSTAQKISPMTPFYFLGGFSSSLVLLALLHCGQTHTVKRFRIPQSYIHLKTGVGVPQTP